VFLGGNEEPRHIARSEMLFKGLGVQDHRVCLSVYRKHEWAPCLVDPIQNFPRFSLQVGDGPNVFCNMNGHKQLKYSINVDHNKTSNSAWSTTTPSPSPK